MNDNAKPVLATVRTTEGPEWVAAYVFGPVMAHLALGTEGWKISHKATGHAFIPRALKKSEAFKVAEELGREDELNGIGIDAQGGITYAKDRKFYATLVRGAFDRAGIDLEKRIGEGE